MVCWHTSALETILAVFVVHLPLALVRKNLVRLGDLLELVLGVGGFVFVRMITQGQFPVGLFDLIVGGSFGQTQDFVVVLTHCRLLLGAGASGF